MMVGDEAKSSPGHDDGVLRHTPSTLLELRALDSLETAKTVLDTLQKPGISKEDIDTAIERAVHDEYMDIC